MKKLLPFLILFSILVYGCKKHEEPELVPIKYETEISFQVDLVEEGGSEKDWPCKLDDMGYLLEPDYAEIWIDGTIYHPAVFRINGVLYTQSIKFLLGTEVSDTLEVTRDTITGVLETVDFSAFDNKEGLNKVSDFISEVFGKLSKEKDSDSSATNQ